MSSLRGVTHLPLGRRSVPDRLGSWWRTYWFAPIPIRRLSIFRIAITVYALVDVTVLSRGFGRYAQVDSVFYEPILLLRILGIPRLGPDATVVIHAVLIVALVLGAVGLFTRPALWTAFATYVWWYATFYSFGKIDHGQIAIVFALGVMAVAPSNGAYALDRLIRHRGRSRGSSLPDGNSATAGWSLAVVRTLVVMTYLLAAYAKIRVSGPGWVTSTTMEFWLVDKDALGAPLLLAFPSGLVAVQTSTLLIEATAFLALVRGRPRYAWLAAAAAFHAGTFVFLGINFSGLVVCYLAFLPLERLARLLRSRPGSITADDPESLDAYQVRSVPG